MQDRGLERDVRWNFPRVWAARNDETVVTFANGHVLDRSGRRDSVRALVRILRRERARTLTIP